PWAGTTVQPLPRGHGAALPKHKQKSPDQKRGFSLQLKPQAEIEPTTRRLGVDISGYSPASRIRRSRDGNDEINDLFDLQASLIGLIVSSQTSLQQLLNQGIDQQLAIKFNRVYKAFFRQLKVVLRCDFNQQGLQTGGDRPFHFTSPSGLFLDTRHHGRTEAQVDVHHIQG
ncbi:hypothetical protein ACFVHT_22360, partial [Bacillus subtilis]